MICVTSVDTIKTPVVDVIGQLIRDVIGRLSVEPRKGSNHLQFYNLLKDENMQTITFKTILAVILLRMLL